MTPENSFSALLKEFGIPQSDLCQVTGLGRSVISRICTHGIWPTFHHIQARQAIDAYLAHRGLTPNQLQRLMHALHKKVGPSVLPTPEAVPVSPATENQTETVKEDPMLLANAGLRPETRAHFKLSRNPFIDDVQSPDDVFQTPSVRYIRAALTDCALHHGFMAVVGESGSGKTTLAEDLQERIRIDGRPITVIKPYVLAMEGNDARGKTLKSSQIAESIACALDPSVRLRSSSEARFRQLHTLLTASRRAGQRHLLVIEEAHCLPIPTLKHLKRFLELKDGMQRLLGIALIGQPELRERLNGQNAEVREVAQRCELVELEPIDTELEGYLQHKFARFDLRLSDVFTADAFDAMRARLIHRPRGGTPADVRSLCYPLVVNNLVCRAMNAAASVPWPQVDAQVIAGC
ncbi:MAG: AAA family ATPase [Comamonadaceae bacterium]|nr:AAA family ATPase [Comamonadaceae bacterium]